MPGTLEGNAGIGWFAWLCLCDGRSDDGDVGRGPEGWTNDPYSYRGRRPYTAAASPAGDGRESRAGCSEGGDDTAWRCGVASAAG